jgi:hypothetical protein
MHLRAHSAEFFEISESLQHGQQGMVALPGIDISTGFDEKETPPVAGTTATEIAISAASIARILIATNYQSIRQERQPVL